MPTPARPPLTPDDCRARDAAHAVADALRARFAPGAPDTLYFDANSIGPMPADAPARVAATLDAGWRVARRRSWNQTDWLDQPRLLGAALAPLIGAAGDSVAVCDSTSVNQYKLLRHALAAAAPRRVMVVEREVFPSNRYIAQGIARAGLGEVRLIDGAGDLAAALAPGDVAVVALSHVDYRDATRLDMGALTALAHAHGALALWDLSHSAGAVAIDLAGSGADFAVACGYKYLCGGPGAPALVYVHPRWQDAAWPALCGWMGHAATFDFAADYAPAPGVARHLVGTPAVLANAAFGAAADLWRDADMAALDRRHASLTDTLIALIDEQCAPLGVEVTSPRAHGRRGGHVALRMTAPDANVSALGQALVAAGVVVSTRKPDALRFGVHPIANTHAELWQAVARLRAILASGSWRDPRFAGEVR
ncbi:MAG: aminotransferase class V-fold PLP-dependent enzyme [Burkholderiales bacterium]|nr:aminotransferase class V-fold PLP-dependent enzyme [Burkholderiales bacterium]